MKAREIELTVNELVHMVACVNMPMCESFSKNGTMSHLSKMVKHARLACALIDNEFPNIKTTVEVVE